MIFSPNFTLLDVLRTVADRTTRGGVVGLGGETEPKPDPLVSKAIGEPANFAPHDTPLARLVDALAEHGGRLHDFRQHVRAKGSRGEAKGTRKIGKVTAIMWHQAAAVLGDPKRYTGVPCHAAVMRNGDVVLLHPLHAYVYHGHAGNSFSVGVEIDCRAAGIEGDARTFWRSAKEKAAGRGHGDLVQEATTKQLESARLLGVYITEEVERLGGRIVAQMFHRNSHSSRTSDPGSKIAVSVAAVLAHRFGHELGGPVVGSGSATPTAWGGPAGVRYSSVVKGF